MFSLNVFLWKKTLNIKVPLPLSAHLSQRGQTQVGPTRKHIQGPHFLSTLKPWGPLGLAGWKITETYSGPALQACLSNVDCGVWCRLLSVSVLKVSPTCLGMGSMRPPYSWACWWHLIRNIPNSLSFPLCEQRLRNDGASLCIEGRQTRCLYPWSNVHNLELRVMTGFSLEGLQGLGAGWAANVLVFLDHLWHILNGKVSFKT